jgi:acetyl esterase/lipase
VTNLKFFQQLLEQVATHGRTEAEAKAAAERGEVPARKGRKAARAGALLAAAAVNGVAAPAVAPAPPPVPPAIDIGDGTYVYKTTDRGPLHIQIVQPEGPAPTGGRPCMVFFHGGGWRRGSAHQFVPLSTMLARHGVVGMSVEYRLLAPEEDAVPHEAIEDARSAMRWVRLHAAQFGCDLKRIGAGGGSAGGTLAMLTSMKVTADDPKDDLRIEPNPGVLVVFNAPFNLDDYPSRVPVAERRRYAPYYLLDKSLPPTLIMQGTKDRTVPFEQAVQFRDKARQIGVKDITLVAFQGRTHGFFNKGKGQPGDFDASAGNMIDFLKRLGWIA